MFGATEQTGYSETLNTLLVGIGHMDVIGNIHLPGTVGEMGMGVRWYVGGIHTDLVSDMHTPGFGNMYAGLIHSDLLGDVYNPGIGEIGTGPVRSCGIMEGGLIGDASIPPVIGDMETTIIGDIPISSARCFGDIYGMGAFGDIHAGLWAGYMITGASQRPGDMPTT